MSVLKGFVAVLGIVGWIGSVNAGFITTTFAGGNANEGVMFDLEVLGPDILVTGADFNFEDLGSTTINVYTRLGSYVGFEGSSAGWTLVSSTFLASTNAEGTPTAVDFVDFLLSSNTVYGLYFVSTNFDVDLSYTNGANTFSNSDVELTLGAGINNLFSGTFSPRTWNGTLNYDVTSVSAPASLLLFGLGLAGLRFSRRKNA